VIAAAPSIRSILLGGTIAVLFVVMGAAAWIAYAAGHREAEELFDARLATSARVLEALVARQLETATVASPIVVALPGPLRTADEHSPTALGHHYETKIAFQVRDDAGRLLARSSSAPQAPLAPLVPGYSASGHWRVFSLRSGRVWVQVADSDEPRNELSAKIAGAAVTPLVVGIPVVLVLLSLLIRHGLAPLAQLTGRIETRDPASTDGIVLDRVPREMAPVLAALNDLLARMQAVLERERRFCADAAHELRTPLAALQVHAQNAARAETDAERRASMDRLLEGLGRTTRLAAQMLELNRAASARAAFGPVALREVVEDAAKQLGVQLPIVGQATVHGDRDQLTSLVLNLLDNAMRHAGGNASVELAGTTLAVEDEGPGIPEDERERVFESYYRLPGAGAGSGLGLAIVGEIARQHGAQVAVASGAHGRGTRMSVAFPAVR
jgi:two-component system sensor histidine kinase QseC